MLLTPPFSINLPGEDVGSIGRYENGHSGDPRTGTLSASAFAVVTDYDQNWAAIGTTFATDNPAFRVTVNYAYVLNAMGMNTISGDAWSALFGASFCGLTLEVQVSHQLGSNDPLNQLLGGPWRRVIDIADTQSFAFIAPGGDNSILVPATPPPLSMVIQRPSLSDLPAPIAELGTLYVVVARLQAWASAGVAAGATAFGQIAIQSFDIE